MVFTKIIITLLFFNVKNSYADLIRSTTFDDRPSCENSGGTWRDFGDICADRCESKFEKYPICSRGINFSCDCGKNRCLHEDKCIPIQEYQKIYSEKIKAETKVIKDIKAKRLKIAKKFQTDHINKLSGIYNADPNYRDPYRYDRERELPQNSFRSTNRMIIYNDIIKKHNEKIALIQKKYQDEIAKLDMNNEDDQVKKADLERQLAKYKTMEQVSEQDLVKNYDNKSNNDDKKNTKKPSEPIILQPIIDDKKNDNITNIANQEKPQNQQNDYKKILSPQDLIKNIDNMINKKTQPIENSTQENSANKNSSNNNSANVKIDNIPPIYVKKQNGEEDFKNGDVGNNDNDIPQFTN